MMNFKICIEYKDTMEHMLQSITHTPVGSGATWETKEISSFNQVNDVPIFSKLTLNKNQLEQSHTLASEQLRPRLRPLLSF
jgi:hypothetical protein